MASTCPYSEIQRAPAKFLITTGGVRDFEFRRVFAKTPGDVIGRAGKIFREEAAVFFFLF